MFRPTVAQPAQLHEVRKTDATLSGFLRAGGASISDATPPTTVQIQTTLFQLLPQNALPPLAGGIHLNEPAESRDSNFVGPKVSHGTESVEFRTKPCKMWESERAKVFFSY